MNLPGSTRHPSYSVQLRLILLPYLVGSSVLVAAPALATLVVAFTHYDALGTPEWVGLANFRQMLNSPLVRLSFRNSLVFVLTAVPLRLSAALFLALLLRRPGRWYALYRAAVFLPTIIPDAAYALVWLWIFNPVFGPVNILLGSLHLPAPAWLTEPATAVAAMIIMSAFQMGEGFVILLAGLQNIPRQLYEAATVDGASAWQIHWRITLPLVMPWLLVLSFRDLVVSLQNSFTPTFMMTYGGPYYATTFLPLLTYEVAFDLFDFGLAAALLVLTYLMVAALIVAVVNLVDIRGKGHAA